jgi:hypothetical protein
MSKTPSVKIVIPLVAVVAATQTYRRNRRNQLALMPKGINTAAGVTMRSSIKAARPTTVGR